MIDTSVSSRLRAYGGPALAPPVPPPPVQESSVVDTIGKVLVTLMDTRVPTTSRLLTDQQKAEIKSVVQPGDILLETNNAYPGWQIAQKLLFGSRYSHCCFYAGDGKVLESVSEAGVRENTLDNFISAYHIAVLRPNFATPQDPPAAMAYCRSVLGRPYDTSFDLSNDDKLYCSELLYNGLNRMPHPITTVPVDQVFGRPIVAPDGFLRSPDMKIVWDSGSGFFKNMATHWPLAAGSAAGAVAGGLLAGCGGAAIGSLAGLAGTWALARFWDPEINKEPVTGRGL